MNLKFLRVNLAFLLGVLTIFCLMSFAQANQCGSKPLGTGFGSESIKSCAFYYSEEYEIKQENPFENLDSKIDVFVETNFIEFSEEVKKELKDKLISIRVIDPILAAQIFLGIANQEWHITDEEDLSNYESYQKTKKNSSPGKLVGLFLKEKRSESDKDNYITFVTGNWEKTTLTSKIAFILQFALRVTTKSYRQLNTSPMNGLIRFFFSSSLKYWYTHDAKKALYNQTYGEEWLFAQVSTHRRLEFAFNSPLLETRFDHKISLRGEDYLFHGISIQFNAWEQADEKNKRNLDKSCAKFRLRKKLDDIKVFYKTIEERKEIFNDVKHSLVSIGGYKEFAVPGNYLEGLTGETGKDGVTTDDCISRTTSWISSFRSRERFSLFSSN